MTIGDKIKTYRIRVGLSQSKLASGICARSYISSFENNRLIPDIRTINMLRERLGIQGVPFTQEEVDEFLYELHHWYHLLLNRQLDEVKEKQEKIKSVTEKMLEESPKIYFSLYESYLFMLENNIEEASVLLQKLLKMKSSFDLKQTYYFYYLYGTLLIYQNDLGNSLEALLFAVNVGNEIGMKEANVYYAIMNLYSQVGCSSHAIVYGLTALDIAKNSSDKRYMLSIEIMLAVNYNTLGLYQMALGLLEGCLLRAKNEKNNLFVGAIYHNLGCVYRNLQNFSAALTHFDLAFTYYDCWGDHYLNNIIHICYTLVELGDSEQALMKVHMALPYAKDNKDKRIMLESIKHSQNLSDRASVKYIEDITIPELVIMKEYHEVIKYCNILKEFFTNNKRKSQKYIDKVYLYTNIAYKYSTIILKGDIHI